MTSSDNFNLLQLKLRPNSSLFFKWGCRRGFRYGNLFTQEQNGYLVVTSEDKGGEEQNWPPYLA